MRTRGFLAGVLTLVFVLGACGGPAEPPDEGKLTLPHNEAVDFNMPIEEIVASTSAELAPIPENFPLYGVYEYHYKVDVEGELTVAGLPVYRAYFTIDSEGVLMQVYYEMYTLDYKKDNAIVQAFMEDKYGSEYEMKSGVYETSVWDLSDVGLRSARFVYRTDKEEGKALMQVIVRRDDAS